MEGIKKPGKKKSEKGWKQKQEHQYKVKRGKEIKSTVLFPPPSLFPPLFRHCLPLGVQGVCHCDSVRTREREREKVRSLIFWSITTDTTRNQGKSKGFRKGRSKRWLEKTEDASG